MSRICRSLKFLREQKNLSINKLAELLCMSKSTYASYEYGAREPNCDMLCKLADYFGVTTDYLLGREPHDTSAPSLSDNESDLIEKYRSITYSQRELLSDIVDAIVKADGKRSDIS